MKRLALFALLALAACSDDDEVRVVEPPPPPPAPNKAPKVSFGHLPDWPPLGPGRSIEVRCSDEDGTVTSVRGVFARTAVKSVRAAPEVTTSFSAAELGEGQGTFRVTCGDGSLFTSRAIADLLVDLTPPRIEPERVVASPNVDGLEGSIGLWVKDAWLLGSIQIDVGGKTFTTELPQKYPETLGQEWDVTYVAIPAKELPLGRTKAIVTARDAAGNEAKDLIELTVDATPPQVAVLAPAPGTTVSGDRMTVRVSASDPDTTTPAAIQLFVGGSPIGDFSGPIVEVVVDTSTLPSGPTEVRAVAHDEAGNEAVSEAVVVQVP